MALLSVLINSVDDEVIYINNLLVYPAHVNFWDESIHIDLYIYILLLSFYIWLEFREKL